MDAAQIPDFIMLNNGAIVTRRLLEFRKQTLLFANETMKGKDPCVRIMKKIIDYPPLRGVSAVNKLFELLKEAVFSYHRANVKVTKCQKQDLQTQLHSSDDTFDQILSLPMSRETSKHYETFLPTKTYRTCKELHKDLLQACKDHEIAVRHLRDAVKSFRDINEKSRKSYEKLQKVAEEFTSCTSAGEQMNFEASGLNLHKKCIQLSSQYNLYKKKAEQAYGNLKPLFEKEKNIRQEKLQKVEDKLRSLIVKEITETLTDGMKNLLKVATCAKFPEDIVENLKSFDCNGVAMKLYNDLCGKYLHPVINETYPDTPIAMTSYVEQRFVAMEKIEQRLRAYGSHVYLLQGGVHETQREELYVWANENLQGRDRIAQLKLKKDTKIKQKLCSADGKIAFGWKRSFAGGPKKYGFYSTDITRLVP